VRHQLDAGRRVARIGRHRLLHQLVGLGRAGRIGGWTFFVLHGTQLQIGALVAEDDAARRALLRAAMAAPEAARADTVACYLYPQSPALRRILEQEGFSVEAHHYMTREPQPAAGRPAARWPAGCAPGPRIDGDADGVVDLVARAYGDSREGRCFAPDLRADQWSHYVSRLVDGEACGRVLPEASFTVRDANRRPVAAILLTAIGEATAHLAQVVVDPGWRGRGLARQSIAEGAGAAARAGFTRVTLLVASGNAAARGLYQSLGFRNRHVFLHATRAGGAGR
jgi:ribosomal protein S18 acetylase RimI-like enzyme